MRSSESPFLADWFAVSMRWLSIVGFTIVLAFTSNLNLSQALVLGGMILWNLINSGLAATNRRLRGHRLWNILVDSALSLLLFTVTGLLTGPLAGCALLVLFSTAIYYSLKISLIVATAVSAGQILLVFLLTPTLLQPLPVALLLGFNFLCAILLGIFGSRLFTRLRADYFNQISKRQDHDRKTQREERSRINAIYQMTETLSSTLNYHDVLEATLDVSAGALGESASASGQLLSAVLLFNQEERLEIGTSRHFPAPDLRNTFQAEEGALKTVLTTAEPFWFSSPGSDPELSSLSGLHTCQSVFLLPLRRGLNAYGVLLFAHPAPDFFNPDRRDLLALIAQQAVIAIQNARLFQDIQEEKQRIIDTQDEARKKLARDLHDGPTQSISAIAMQVNIARKLLEQDPARAGNEMSKIEELARRTTQEMRHMLFTLRPLVLESEGLQAALQTMADKMQDIFQQKVVIQVNQDVIQELDNSRQTIIFFLAEEAVNNARKHARASLVGVRLDYSPTDQEMALLEIADNGVGFDLQTVSGSYERRGSLGMINLQERTRLINGLLSIDTAPGKGTRVKILIPLTDSAYQRLQTGQISP